MPSPSTPTPISLSFHQGSDPRQLLRAHLSCERTLFQTCLRISARRPRRYALIHLVAAASGLARAPAEDDRVGAGSPIDLIHQIDRTFADALRDRSGFGALEGLPASSEMIRAYLHGCPPHLMPGHQRLRLLADLSFSTRGDDEDTTTFRRLGLAIATGRRAEALAELSARGRYSLATPIVRLIETGVVHLPGRRPRAIFAGCLDTPEDVRAFAPSVPLLRDLLSRGPAWRRAAALVLRDLRGREAEEGRAIRDASRRQISPVAPEMPGEALAAAVFLIEDPTAALDLVRRSPADAVQALLERAPRHIARRLSATLAGARVMAGALDLIDARREIARIVEDPAAPVTPDSAFLLGALGAASSWDRCRHDPRFAEAVSPERSFYDEGVSLSAHASTRRTALLDACRASLRAVTAAPAEDAAPIVGSRLRCLVNLGGEAAATVVRRLIEVSPDSGGAHAPALFAALAVLAPQQAMRLFVERCASIAAAPDPGGAATRLACLRGLDRGYAERWQAAIGRLSPRMGEEGAIAWLDSFACAFTARGGDLPGVEALAAVGAPGDDLPASGEAFVDRLVSARDAALHRDSEGFLGALHDDPDLLRALLMLTPEGAIGPSKRWLLADWTQVVGRLRHGLGRLAAGPLQKLQEALPDGDRVASALIRGAPPSAALACPIALDATHSLRWLDKRRDFCAALRFPDALPNCFNSSAAQYRGGYDTQRDVLGIWKDPLSFCFSVQKHSEVGASEHVGFAFGSFGLTARGPVALLSGIYLRRQTAQLREAALAAIEEALCRPLGLRSIAVSARYSGDGPMPAGYQRERRPVRRLRALESPDGAMNRLRDDLGLDANVDAVTNSSVYWSDLDRSVLQAAS